MKSRTVAVFTGKDLTIMADEGGSGYWIAKSDRLKSAEYLIAVRNLRETWAIKDNKHGTAFLIARITGCSKTDRHAGRTVITFEEYAEICVPDAWKKLTGGQRYPVAYLDTQTAFEELRINPEKLEWKKFSELAPSIAEKTEPQPVVQLSLSEAVAEAKKFISGATGISESAIAISISL